MYNPSFIDVRFIGYPFSFRGEKRRGPPSVRPLHRSSLPRGQAALGQRFGSCTRRASASCSSLFQQRRAPGQTTTHRCRVRANDNAPLLERRLLRGDLFLHANAFRDRNCNELMNIVIVVYISNTNTRHDMARVRSCYQKQGKTNGFGQVVVRIS